MNPEAPFFRYENTRRLQSTQMPRRVGLVDPKDGFHFA